MSAELVHAYEWDTTDVQRFIGLGLGKDELFLYESRKSGAGERVSAFDTEDVVRAFDFSPQERGLVCYGLNSGNVHLRGFEDGQYPITFKPKLARRCNTVSFNTTALLASGYDKNRGNESLLLWDIGSDSPDPIVSEFSNETITSVKFAPLQPTSLICGGSRMLREVDTRTGKPVTSVSTNLVHGIRFNPVSDNLFGSCDFSSLALWDKRMLVKAVNSQSEPLLVIPHVFKDHNKDLGCYRFSPNCRSEISALQDGSMIRRWQVSIIPSAQGHPSRTSQLSSELSTQKNKSQAEAESADDASVRLFVNRVLNVRTETDKVVSFDYANSMSTGKLDFVCIRQSGSIFRMPISGPPPSIYFDPFNEVNILLSAERLVEIPGGEVSDTRVSDLNIAQPWDAEKARDPNQLAERDLTSLSFRSSKQDDAMISDDSDTSLNLDGDSSSSKTSYDSDYIGAEAPVHSVLGKDITIAMQQRALAGYSLDPVKNIDVLVESQTKQRSSASSGMLAAWKWLKQQQALFNGPTNFLETPDVDLRYIGVSSIWMGLSRETIKHRLSKKAKTKTKTVDDAVKYAVRRSPGSVYVSYKDDDEAYRQLCLLLCGWDFGLSDLEPRLQQLEAKGQYEKAAGWAVFHNDVERAVESLAKSRKQNMRLMSTAVAGYLVYKDVPNNNVWREQCRSLASRLSAPYLRAIFAYISDGSWLDVLDDGALPMTERLGIAFRFLPPKEVGKYLSLLTSRAIANGDLEGIILTGFTPKLLDLLQVYLDRTSDIQTVSALVSYGWPRFFDDSRIPIWIGEYRQLLNSWQYFSERARFDVARNKLGSSPYHRSKRPIKPQAFLKCSNCKSVIAGRMDEDPEVKKSAAAKKSGGGERDAPRSWNRCPYCNHPLPPCGVCRMPLGPSLDDSLESDKWPVFCLNCNHGHHAVHARQWFNRYDICPFPSCKCLCGLMRI